MVSTIKNYLSTKCQFLTLPTLEELLNETPVNKFSLFIKTSQETIMIKNYI